MKYDDASWHYGGEFPDDLPQSAGATHIAMFVVWALLNGLGGDLHVKEFAGELERLRAREQSPARWFIQACDEKFTNEDLNPTGNAFADFYYGGTAGLRTDDGSYLGDYEATFPGLKSLYHVPDDWVTFDRLDKIIRRRFEDWKATSRRMG